MHLEPPSPSLDGKGHRLHNPASRTSQERMLGPDEPVGVDQSGRRRIPMSYRSSIDGERGKVTLDLIGMPLFDVGPRERGHFPGAGKQTAGPVVGRIKTKVAAGSVEGNTGARLDVGVAPDGFPRQGGPNRVRTYPPRDAGLIIVTGVHPLVISRPGTDQKHGSTCFSQVAGRRRSDESGPDNRDVDRRFRHGYALGGGQLSLGSQKRDSGSSANIRTGRRRDKNSSSMVRTSVTRERLPTAAKDQYPGPPPDEDGWAQGTIDDCGS